METQEVRVLMFKPSGKWQHEFKVRIPKTEPWDPNLMEIIDKHQTDVAKGCYKQYFVVITDYEGEHHMMGLWYPETVESLKEVRRWANHGLEP
jgi:hypothetical protein